MENERELKKTMTTQKQNNDSTLFSQNIFTVLTEKTISKKNYDDFMTFLRSNIQPDLSCLSELLGKTITLGELEDRLDIKVYEAMQSDLRSDYLKYKSNIFTRAIRLFLKCKSCKKDFDSGIVVTNEEFITIKIQGQHHNCPACQFDNVANKCDYEVREVSELFLQNKLSRPNTFEK